MEHSAFRRDSDIAVLDRVYPAFQPQGVPIGGLELFPSLTLGAQPRSNVFANNGNKHGDIAALIIPEATLRTRGGPVDLDLHGRASISRFSRYQSENSEEETGGITANAEIGPLSRLFADASAGNLILSRQAADSPGDAAKPLEYTEMKGDLGAVFEAARTRVTARLDGVRLHFRDGVRRDGSPISTDDRDRTIVSGIVRLERSIKPNTSVYLAATGNSVTYRLSPPRAPLQRDSKGFGVYVGSSFELTRLIRGDVRVGYIRQKFDMPGVRSISGLGLKGSLTYFPTGLTTVSLRGERSVQDTGVPGTTGYVHAGGQVQVDHELRRYVILTAQAGYFRDNYRGQPRIDHTSYAALSGTYRSVHHWDAKLAYEFDRRHCSCTAGAPNFADHRLLASLTFRY